MLNLHIHGRDLRLGEQFQEKAHAKLSKYAKYFTDEIETQVRVKKEAECFVVEITMKVRKYILRAEGRAEDLLLALDEASDRLDGQMRKQKTKLLRKHKEKDFLIEQVFVKEYPETEEEKRIVKNKKFRLEYLDEEEAVMQMELLGHDFLLYRDIESGNVSVVYRRKDGHYGKIDECE